MKRSVTIEIKINGSYTKKCIEDEKYRDNAKIWMRELYDEVRAISREYVSCVEITWFQGQYIDSNREEEGSISKHKYKYKRVTPVMFDDLIDRKILKDCGSRVIRITT